MSNLDLHELRPDELAECLDFRNGIFTPVDDDQWLAMKCTAVIARDEGQLVGFIPLQFRRQVIRPGLSIPVVYENAVGVAEKRRSSGIGTKMMNEAAEFMADRADAMMVVRSDERSIGYRFYRRTGHSDVNYALPYLLPPEERLPDEGGHEVTSVDRARWLSYEKELLLLHDERYSTYAGGRPRGSGYWGMIHSSHVFKGKQWTSLLAKRDGMVTGYLVGIFGTWEHKEDINVLEAVAVDDSALLCLVAAARKLSASGAIRFPLVSLANPIRPILERFGFSDGETTPHIMARLLRPDRIFSQLAAGTGLTESLSLTLVTPHRTVLLNEVADPKYTVRMELKEHDLTRLLLCRLNLEASLDTEAVRWTNRDTGLERELALIFCFADWVQWFTDYV